MNLADGFKRLIDALDSLCIPYMIGGSVASSIHGIPRMTNDVDLVADIKWNQVDAFADALRPDFYADEDLMKSAVRLGRSFNLIHLKSAYKFDIFPLAGSPFRAAEFARRAMVKSSQFGEIEFPVASAEDTLLSKLEWFRQGGEVSDRQWNDIVGIIRIRAGELDLEYLRRWAVELRVSGLLERALSQP